MCPCPLERHQLFLTLNLHEMKKVLCTFLLTLAVFFCNSLIAQTILFENFTSLSSVPSDWHVSKNTGVTTYSRPGTCTVTDYGLITPGLGGNLNFGMILPAVTFDANNPHVTVNFKLYYVDASPNCNVVNPFPCDPIVDAYLVPITWTDFGKSPGVNQYYKYLSYAIKNANANNTLIFNNVSLPAGVTQFRVFLNFKSATSGCNFGGSKFIFDDISIIKSQCATSCAPVANNDYFKSDAQNFTTQLKGNVYGGFALWSSQAPTGFATNSLSTHPAANNGTDYDLNNLNLTDMTFTQVGPLTIESTKGCAENGSPNPGTLTFNSNGTFTYNSVNPCVKRVSFTYKVKQNVSPGLESGIAKVTIDLPGADIVLPVKFKSFIATRNNQKKEQVLLKWETASEQNNRGFYIQRKTSGEWKNIAFVFSVADKGNSNATLAYEYKEMNTSSGVTQYQLQQVDMDGKTSYSDVKAVMGMEQKGSVLIFPNPSSNGKVNLVFSEHNVARDVLVSDMSGRIVKQYRQVRDGSIEIEGLKSGFYTIKITNHSNSVSTVEKVIVK